MWIISLFSGLGVLLYTYAALGEEVVLSNDTSGFRTISREVYFYAGLGLLVIFNFTFYALSRNMHLSNYALKKALIGWQLGLAALLNFFFMAGALFIMLFNSGEKFNYSNFGYLIYVALGLLLLWVIALPLVISRNRPVRET